MSNADIENIPIPESEDIKQLLRANPLGGLVRRTAGKLFRYLHGDFRGGSTKENPRENPKRILSVDHVN